MGREETCSVGTERQAGREVEVFILYTLCLSHCPYLACSQASSQLTPPPPHTLTPTPWTGRAWGSRLTTWSSRREWRGGRSPDQSRRKLEYSAGQNVFISIDLWWWWWWCLYPVVNFCLKSILSIRMMTYISENQKGDHLIHPPDKKNNPWMEKVRKLKYFKILYIYNSCHQH